jgi:ribokinase
MDYKSLGPEKKHFAVLGSLNMDMVTRTPRFPSLGETIKGFSFKVFPGGKGANQAVALARLGAPVKMLGALGDDVLGSMYLETLKNENVDIKDVRILANQSTGTASIEVSQAGDNRIIIVPGANDLIDNSLVSRLRELSGSIKMLLLQLEIPLEATVKAAEMASSLGIPVMLDPAPAQALPPELYSLIDIITPNETEAEILTGEETKTEKGLRSAIGILHSRGVKIVVIKVGARGAWISDGRSAIHVPPFPVAAIDTVAAGDSFNAGLAFALGRNQGLVESARFANAAGALSTTKEGAQSAMPSLREVERFLKQRES